MGDIMGRTLFAAIVAIVGLASASAASLPYAASPHRSQAVVAAADLSIHFG